MNASKPRLVGLNHIAFEVGDINKALLLYNSVFEFELRGTHEDEHGHSIMAFVDMGD